MYNTPNLDHTESVANICIEKTTVIPANGVTIAEAFLTKIIRYFD